MQYIFLGLILIALSGCGSNSSNDGENINSGGEQSDRPASPTPQESSKQPPSIPNIN